MRRLRRLLPELALAGLLASCAGLDRTLSTVEVFGSQNHSDWERGPAERDGYEVGLSVRPLAALEPPQEVRIISAPLDWPLPVLPVDAPPHVDSAKPAPKPEPWWYTTEGTIVVVTGAAGALGAAGFGARRGVQAYRRKKRKDAA